MKEIKISSEHAILEKRDYSFNVNGENLTELINKCLPENMESLKNYAGEIELKIKIYGIETNTLKIEKSEDVCNEIISE